MLQKEMRQRPQKEDFTVQFIRLLLLQMNEEKRCDFIRRVTTDFAPDIQVKVFAFVKAVICSWAVRADLSEEDAEVVEASWKICDFMGWKPGRD